MPDQYGQMTPAEMAGSFSNKRSVLRNLSKANFQPLYAQQIQPFTDADSYRKALERASYEQAGRGLSTGLQGISGFLSTRGPLSDSGAAPALAARLAQGLYGGAANRVAGGYAQYLAQALSARRQYQYQLALLKAQKKMQQTGIGGVLGGVAGAIGGPFLGAVGTNLANRWTQ